MILNHKFCAWCQPSHCGCRCAYHCKANWQSNVNYFHSFWRVRAAIRKRNWKVSRVALFGVIMQQTTARRVFFCVCKRASCRHGSCEHWISIWVMNENRAASATGFHLLIVEFRAFFCVYVCVCTRRWWKKNTKRENVNYIKTIYELCELEEVMMFFIKQL